MSLFLTRKKREQINDDIDDLNMKIHHCRCKIEQAEQRNDDHMIEHEEKRIAEYEKEINHLSRKLR